MWSYSLERVYQEKELLKKNWHKNFSRKTSQEKLLLLSSCFQIMFPLEQEVP